MFSTEAFGLITKISMIDERGNQWLANFKTFLPVHNRETGDWTIYRPVYIVTCLVNLESAMRAKVREGDLLRIKANRRFLNGKEAWEIFAFDVVKQRAWSDIYVPGHVLAARMAGATIFHVFERKAFDDGAEPAEILGNEFFTNPARMGLN